MWLWRGVAWREARPVGRLGQSWFSCRQAAHWRCVLCAPGPRPPKPRCPPCWPHARPMPHASFDAKLGRVLRMQLAPSITAVVRQCSGTLVHMRRCAVLHLRQSTGRSLATRQALIETRHGGANLSSPSFGSPSSIPPPIQGAKVVLCEDGVSCETRPDC